jgi:hypothetical protein
MRRSCAGLSRRRRNKRKMGCRAFAVLLCTRQAARTEDALLNRQAERYILI